MKIQIFIFILVFKSALCEWIWQKQKKSGRSAKSAENSISFSDVLKGTNFEYNAHPVSLPPHLYATLEWMLSS